jgi:hypothetical protein
MKNKIATPNGIEEVELTAEKILEKEKIEQDAQVKQQKYETVKLQQKQDALDGNNKLLELGLTQSQVTAMTGYIPLSVKYQNLIDEGFSQAEATALTGYTPPVAE